VEIWSIRCFSALEFHLIRESAVSVWKAFRSLRAFILWEGTLCVL
jgi:hypothetical protein